jgi:hypothetical protein
VDPETGRTVAIVEIAEPVVSTPPAKGREDPGAGWADVTEVVTDEVGRMA